MPLSIAVGSLIRKKATHVGGSADAKYSLRNYYLACLAFISIGTVFALTSFCDAKPFGGTLMLCSGVFFLFIFLSNLRMPKAELASKINENYEKSPFDLQTLKAAFRLPLRDFFWLTIVIGLSALIVVEHKRTRALSEHPGRAEWWSRAERLLHVKHEELSMK